jgi:hypothetical protein
MNELMIVSQTIDSDIAICLGWAKYWETMAITGVATQRNIIKGNGQPLTPDELTKEAMDTASRHLHRASELLEIKKETLFKIHGKNSIL